MNFITFGTKHRQPVQLRKPDLWVDCRKFPNPHHEYREQTGKDEAVAAWLTEKINGSETYKRMFDAIITMVENTRSRVGTNARIVFYCIGGRHRSVYVAERVATELRSVQHQVDVEHLELQ